MASFMGRVLGHQVEAKGVGLRAAGTTSDVMSTREIEVSVQGCLAAPSDGERFDLVTDEIDSGTNLEIGCVRTVGRGLAFEPGGNFDLRGGDWHPSATPLDAIAEAA